MGGCCFKRRKRSEKDRETEKAESEPESSESPPPPDPAPNRPEQASETEERIMDAQTNAIFAINLLNRLHGKSEGTGTFVSPMSVSTALGMVYAGAKGQTAEEMGAVLFPGAKDSNAVHAFFASITDILNPSTSAFILHSANRLYVQKNMAFKEEFLHICANKYKASLAQVDFMTPKECSKAADEMNKWVDMTTKGLITDIVSPDDLTDLTRLVVINAIYFKLDMMKHMYGPEDLAYMENEAVQVLRLPYKSDLGNNSMDMVIILPKQRYGIEDWLNKSSAEDVMTLINSTQGTRVIVTLDRKWRMEVTMDLSSELEEMGMPSAFDPFKAEFGGMADLNSIFISKVIQKAFVEVNEEGTEAAAATVDYISQCAPRVPPPPPKIFKADHPFVFLLNSGPHILFAGVFQG